MPLDVFLQTKIVVSDWSLLIRDQPIMWPDITVRTEEACGKCFGRKVALSLIYRASQKHGLLTQYAHYTLHNAELGMFYKNKGRYDLLVQFVLFK